MINLVAHPEGSSKEGPPRRPCQFWRVFQGLPRGLSRKVPQGGSPRPCQFWRVFPRPCRFWRVPRRFPRWAGSCGVGFPRTFPQGSPKASRRSPRIGRAVRAEAFKGMVSLSKGRPRFQKMPPWLALIGIGWIWEASGWLWLKLCLALAGSGWPLLALAGSG